MDKDTTNQDEVPEEAKNILVDNNYLDSNNDNNDDDKRVMIDDKKDINNDK